MHKQCEEILKMLEMEGKINVLRGFEFPEKQELKIRLKDILDDVVEEKFYLKDYQIKNIVNSDFAQKSKLIQEKDVCDTLLARDYKDPKCIQAGTLGIKGKVMIENKQCILVKNATKKGYQEAYDGDSINLAYPQSKTRRGRVGDQIAQTLMTADNMGVVKDLRIRKLTPKECWRLMGFDDEDFEKASKVCSNSQLYKQAGNSIVVNVLVEIFTKLLN